MAPDACGICSRPTADGVAVSGIDAVICGSCGQRVEQLLRTGSRHQVDVWRVERPLDIDDPRVVASRTVRGGDVEIIDGLICVELGAAYKEEGLVANALREIGNALSLGPDSPAWEGALRLALDPALTRPHALRTLARLVRDVDVVS